MLNLLAAPLLALSSAFGQAAPQPVSYRVDATDMEGMFYSAGPQKAPTVMIAPDWDGYSAHEDRVAKKLVSRGFHVFVADVYGAHLRPKNVAESQAAAANLRSMPDVWTRRMRVGLDKALAQPGVDRGRVSVFGYCLGGTGAINLARSGDGRARTFIAFHPGLNVSTGDEVQDVKRPILILNGKDDPMVPQAARERFFNAMNSANKPFRSVTYPGAVHAFTVLEAGNDKSKGSAYDEFADKESWTEAESFMSLFAN